MKDSSTSKKNISKYMSPGNSDAGGPDPQCDLNLPLADLLFSACFKPSQEGFFNAILMPPFLFLTLF
jgi:hypothetical protein